LSAAEITSDAEEGEAPAAAAKKPRFSKRTMMIGGGAIVLVLVLVIAAFFFMKPSAEADGAAAEAHGEKTSEEKGEEETYVDAPAMVINLRSPDGAARFLKIRFTLVPASAAKGDEVKKKLPLIIDAFQPFLRELRPEDLAGSAAVFRIKEELLVRATGAMGPDVVKDILIQDLIQQ